jgi:hypothetical protein
MNCRAGLREGEIVLATSIAGGGNRLSRSERIRIQAYCSLTTHPQPLQSERQPFRKGSTLRSD